MQTPQDAPQRERNSAHHAGQLVREWRSRRGLSQLELAMRSGFSTRHVSFIETGRAQPSRQALLAIAESLEVPLRERNRILEAAGFARVFRQTPFDDDELQHVRGVLRFILDRHEPYGAVVLDRYADLVMANRPALQLLHGVVAQELLEGEVNLLRVTFHPNGLRRVILNWEVVATSILARAEHELGDLVAVSNDAKARALLEECRSYMAARDVAVAPSATGRPTLQAPEILLPLHMRLGTTDVKLFTTIMTLGTPQDVTLQELRVETFFPADAASEAALRGLAPA